MSKDSPNPQAVKAWSAAEGIMAEFRDEPDEVSVNSVAAVIYDLLRKEKRASADRIAEAQQRILELEALLSPFAKAFDHLPEYALAHDPQSIWDTDAAQQIKVADLRHAYAALAKGESE